MSKNWTNNTSIVFSVAIFFFALLKSNKTWHKVYSIIAHTHPIYHDINLLFCCCCCYLKPINKLKHFKSLYDKSHRSYVRAKKKLRYLLLVSFFFAFYYLLLNVRPVQANHIRRLNSSQLVSCRSGVVGYFNSCRRWSEHTATHNWIQDKII